jgi:beta-glucosidase
MRPKAICYLILILVAVHSCEYPGNRSGTAKDAAMDQFISDLMQKMTLEEKIGQMNLVSVGFDMTGPRVSDQVEEKIVKGLVGGVFNTYTPVAVRKLQEMAVNQSRLGIPLIFGFDVVHGHRTIFPVPLGLAATWDMEAIELTARIAAEEASAEGLNWTFSPMVDIARDPRWGRICEGSGEDAWYGSLVASAMVKGYQGDDLSAGNTLMACVKHFALYGGAMAGRDYNTVDMSIRQMKEDYFPPYRAAVDAGAGSVMTSFNDINGVPATCNKWLLTELLRKQWGFEGFVVTDYTAVEELIPFGVAKDAPDAARLSLEAGVDMDMVSEIMVEHIGALRKEERVSQELIDNACRRILEAKYKLGLFEDPYRYVDGKRAEETVLKQEFRDAAREIACKSMVLLKNENGTLPLNKEGSIALIGPLVKSRRDVQGNWRGAGRDGDAISVEQGIRDLTGSDVLIHYAKGANLTDDIQLLYKLNGHGGGLESHPPKELLNEALRVASRSDVVVAVVGESQGMSGESACRTELGIPESQANLLKALKNTGKPLVIVLMNGRPLTLEWEHAHADAILETWFAGTEAGHAIADVLFGVYNPSGKLTATFPRKVGQVPIHYNHKKIGRPYGGDPLDKFKSQYLDVSNEPLYPFGYGLSYTGFAYSNLKLSSTQLEPSGSIQVAVEVTNTGKYAGEEVVQLYVQDLVGSVTRPVKELKGYQKIFLEAGDGQTVTFTITEEDLRFYNMDMEYVAEPGDFKVYVGTNSRDVLEAEFSLDEQL